MKFGWTLAGVGFAAATLAGAAQAADVRVSVRAGGTDWQRPVADYEVGDEERFAPDHRGGGYRPETYDERSPLQRHHWSRPVFARPVFGRPGWDSAEECRIIIKRRVNPWGDVVVRRIKICE